MLTYDIYLVMLTYDICLDFPYLVDIVSDEVWVVKLFIPVHSSVSKKLVMILKLIIKSLNVD